MIRDNVRMHRASVFLLIVFLMLMLVLLLAIWAIEVNCPYLSVEANCERYRAGKNKNLFLHVRSYVFCSGGRVGCGGLGKCRRHACRYSGRLATPKTFGAR